MKKNKFLNIGIVRSTYYDRIEFNMHAGAMFVIDSQNRKNKLFAENKIQYQNIPAAGSFEIPNLISRHINKFDAFLALGCVIKGKTPHFDLISQAVTKAIMHLSIKYKKPIGNGIITSLNMKQAVDRANPKRKNKGGEAAEAVISVIDQI